MHDTQAYRAIKRSIVRWKPDVVHTHSAKGGLLGRAAAWSLQVPCVIHTVHGAPFHPFQNRWSRSFFVACERWRQEMPSYDLGCRSNDADLMVGAKVAPRSQFTRFTAGWRWSLFWRAETTERRCESSSGFSEEHIVFGKIARLFHLKGHEYVNRRCSPNRGPIAQRTILVRRDGLLRETLEGRIARSSLRDRFVFAGWFLLARSHAT